MHTPLAVKIVQTESSVKSIGTLVWYADLSNHSVVLECFLTAVEERCSYKCFSYVVFLEVVIEPTAVHHFHHDHNIVVLHHHAKEAHYVS